MIGSIVFAQDQKTTYETDALELVKKSNNSVETALEPILDEMYEKFSNIYMEEFTHKEIKGVLEFYDSELGEKLLEGQSTIMEKSMSVGQDFSTKVMPIYQKYM
ncbi:MAG: DUF2059 domain-containing protein [Psychroflexus sp.]|nr:DUF2059 domain-containing protein [Psychroflexus sp.]MDN6309470.1 DUF2059 domain-containing protein [Psychroflexus sp.]